MCAEEHQVSAGLGSAVAECLVKNHPVPMDLVGMPDSFGESGEPGELMERYGMSAEQIVLKAKNVISKK